MLTSSFVPSFGDLSEYISKVQEFPMLSAEEELSAAKNWHESGNVEDAHKLVTSHLRLVVKIATDFKNYGLPVMELIMEGNVGLMQAVKKFNPFLGFRLSTYAIWWIKASIKDYILKSWSFVKLGTTQAQRKLFFSLRKIKKRILKYGDVSASLSKQDVASIAEECAVSKREVVDMENRLALRDRSMNEVVRDGNGEHISELQDNIASSSPNQEALYLQNEETHIKSKIFQDALAQLGERARSIFVKRRLVDNPWTLADLGKEHGVSPERIRQIENQALDSVKNFVNDNREEFGY